MIVIVCVFAICFYRCNKQAARGRRVIQNKVCDALIDWLGLSPLTNPSGWISIYLLIISISSIVL